jgi:hypothetical protein
MDLKTQTIHEYLTKDAALENSPQSMVSAASLSANGCLFIKEFITCLLHKNKNLIPTAA